MDTEVQQILELLIDEDLINYKCFDILKEKLKESPQFRETIKLGIEAGFISKFPRELFERVCEQNIRAPFEPIQLFIDGANLGNCTIMSKIVSYSLPQCEICGGTLGILEGTKNSPDGRHTWISAEGNIIDTSLMITISEAFKQNLGYIEENRYNPDLDQYYRVAKDFANDKNLRSKK